MGRKPKDYRLEQVKDKVLGNIASEEDPVKLREWLACYKLVISILDREKEVKVKRKEEKAKLAMPRG